MAEGRRWVTSPVVGGIVGVFAGGMTIFLLEAAGHRAFGTANPLQGETVTTPMFASVLVAWVVGAWVAGTVAAVWSKTASLVTGAVVGGVLLAGAVTNLVAFPHPVWMMVAAVVLIPAGSVLGFKLRMPRRA
jgi:hypothetical protein